MKNKTGNSWDPDIVYNCKKCGVGNLCDVDHLHQVPRGSCDECPPEEPEDD